MAISGKSIGSAAIAAMSALGVNAVPVLGLLVGGWPPATAMAIYLAEAMLIAGVTALRLRLLAPARWEVRTPPGMVVLQPPATRWRARLQKTQTRAELIQGFLLLSGSFALGSGVFLLVITLKAGLIDLELTGRVLGPSLLAVALFQLLSLAADTVLLGRVSQERAEAWMRQSLGRVFLIYGAVFAGTVLALFVHATWFIGPFIALKLISDVGGPVALTIRQLRGA
jgi:hypothetical protein